MAAPLTRSWEKSVFRYINRKSASYIHASQCYYNEGPVDKNEQRKVQYPPVKPKYPPSGGWNGFQPDSAWRLDEIGQELLKIRKARYRLEALAGKENQTLWKVESFATRPKSLNFYKHITRTHILDEFPSLYFNSIDEARYDSLQVVISDILSQEFDYAYKAKLADDFDSEQPEDVQKFVTHRVLGNILLFMRSYLSQSWTHLRRCQVDENCRVEAFWKCSGFKGKAEIPGVTKEILDTDKSPIGMLTFQLKHLVDWQIRTEQPLNEIVPLADPLCRNKVERTDYNPDMAFLSTIEDRPISISGHWTGDPCEWTTLAVNVVPHKEYTAMKDIGPESTEEAVLTFGLLTAFASCLAQAHNQGFCYPLDVTYPITTQCLITDGHWMRFFMYQMNTLQVFKEQSALGNPLCNLCWVSPTIPLYEKTEENKLKMNKEALLILTNSLLMEPGRKDDVNLRPYLGEPSPLTVTKLINDLGEDPLPHEFFDRRNCPRNPVYF